MKQQRYVTAHVDTLSLLSALVKLDGRSNGSYQIPLNMIEGKPKMFMWLVQVRGYLWYHFDPPNLSRLYDALNKNVQTI